MSVHTFIDGRGRKNLLPKTSEHGRLDIFQCNLNQDAVSMNRVSNVQTNVDSGHQRDGKSPAGNWQKRSLFGVGDFGCHYVFVGVTESLAFVIGP